MVSSKQQRAFQIISHIILIGMTICMIAPLILLFSSSISSEQSLIVGGYSFLPKELSFSAYRYILNHGETVFRAYGITILTTVIGTMINVLFCSMLAYPLSLAKLPGRRFWMFFIFFTMLFNGGLVPTYLMFTGIFHIKNTLAAHIIPGGILVSAMNVLLIRTYIENTIPATLFEAAKVDGAGELLIYAKIVLPLGKPILVTMGLFSGLNYWNNWINGLYYVTDPKWYSIQNFLNKMITDAQFLLNNADFTGGAVVDIPTTSIRMAIAFVAMLPIILVYPFLQKYFAKGIALGAVKG